MTRVSGQKSSDLFCLRVFSHSGLTFDRILTEFDFRNFTGQGKCDQITLKETTTLYLFTNKEMLSFYEHVCSEQMKLHRPHERSVIFQKGVKMLFM